MQLTEICFALLSYIEEHGIKEYTVRELSDNLNISDLTAEKVYNRLSEEGFLNTSEGNTEISRTGLELLEPYKVERAVIFAAGFGSRMVPVTCDTPKPLVKVNGVRIIDRLIDALTAKGITDITVVRGYLKEKFDILLEKYPFINFRDNVKYETENNISSAIIAGEKIDNCYICAGDLLISNPDIIKKYHYSSNYLASYALETDDWCFDFNKGYAENYRKGGSFCFNQYEIAYWNKEDSAKLREDFKRAYLEAGGKNLFWEFVPLVRYKEKYKVEIRQCLKTDIMEIDNFSELVQVDPSYKDYRAQ